MILLVRPRTPLLIFCIHSIPAVGPFSNIKGLTYYRNNDEDPYITMKEVSDPDVLSCSHVAYT